MHRPVCPPSQISIRSAISKARAALSYSVPVVRAGLAGRNARPGTLETCHCNTDISHQTRLQYTPRRLRTPHVQPMTTSGSRQRLLTVPPFHADQSRDFVPLPLRFRVLSGLWPLARNCTTPKIQLQATACRRFSVASACTGSHSSQLFYHSSTLTRRVAVLQC